MIVKFTGGPYDGTKIDQKDINRFCNLMPVGIRKYVLMPSPKDWEAVKQGKNTEGPLHRYELIRTGIHMEAVYDEKGEVFSTALKEYNESKQIIPEVPFTGQYYCCLHDEGQLNVTRADAFPVIDEKDRNWLCFPYCREEGEKDGHCILAEPNANRVTIILCEDKGE